MVQSLSCSCGYQWPAGVTVDASRVCPQCGTIADRTPSADDATLSATQAHTDPWATRTAGSRSGDTIDTSAPAVPGYAILDELGRGGMGVVYRARELSLNRQVALKVLLSGAHAGSRDLARFHAEAAAAAGLQHPNIVQVYAFGQSGGLPYIALELMPNGSLQHRLKEGRMPAKAAAEVVRFIARGVQAAHERGIVHRDLKPANVLFASTGEPKVADFGLAKVGDSGLTASGAIMGTPAYMSPEQARGDTKAAGPPADIWALGAVLYECLSGRQPFEAQSPPEIFRLVCEGDPAPLRNVPVDLATIALKCLEKDPARRYASAGNVADDIGRFLNGEPILAKRRSIGARTVRWLSKRQGPVFLLAGALLALAIVLIFLPKREKAATTEPEHAKQPDAETSGNENPKKEPIVGEMQKSNWKMTSANNLRQIAIAAHNLSAVSDGIPPDAIFDQKTGKPLLSWRVAYLPFLDEDCVRLFKLFKLDEPWDSPHNSKLIERMPKVYELPGKNAPKGQTFYQKFTGPGTIFDSEKYRAGGMHGKQGIKFERITDGTAFTLMMAEAAEPVVWTKPEDLKVAPDRPLPKLGGHFENGYYVAMADGHVVFVNNTVSERTLRAMLSPNGDEKLPAEWPDSPEAKKKSKK